MTQATPRPARAAIASQNRSRSRRPLRCFLHAPTEKAPRADRRPKKLGTWPPVRFADGSGYTRDGRLGIHRQRSPQPLAFNPQRPACAPSLTSAPPKPSAGLRRPAPASSRQQSAAGSACLRHDIANQSRTREATCLRRCVRESAETQRPSPPRAAGEPGFLRCPSRQRGVVSSRIAGHGTATLPRPSRQRRASRLAAGSPSAVVSPARSIWIVRTAAFASATLRAVVGVRGVRRRQNTST